MKNICILGSTGSIGTQALDIIRNNRERYNVIALSANSRVDVLIDQALEFMPKYVVVMSDQAYPYLCQRLANHGIKVLKGVEGLETISSLDEVEMVLTSLVGMIGLRPTIAAIRSGKTIALANKETLVVGGEIIAQELRNSTSKILPVDSEHSALYQCLEGEDKKTINNLILTASGGPFRGRKKSELCNITPEMALKHPKWNMGKKISIDSATLMNKALEVIEAHWLFNVGYDNIKVVVHPQSIIHSMVEYIDGSIIAQMSNTDMRHPIQYAFEYPERQKSVIGYLDLIKNNTFNFEEPDYETFECLSLGYEAGRTGGTMPAVLNAANEEAVRLFLENKIKFLEIPEIIKESMVHFKVEYKPTLHRILEIETATREYVNLIIK